MFGQTLSAVEIETLKTHKFHPCLVLVEISQLCHVIGERMEVTPMIGIDPHSVYQFRYPLF